MGTHSGRIVLLVEDDLQIRQLISAVLEGEGFSVYKAGNATEAFAAFLGRPQEIDLLITDVEMGEPMDGFALAGRIRQDCPGIAVLLISGIPDSARQAAQLRLPFLAKPFRLPVLLQEVRNALKAATRQGEPTSPGSSTQSNERFFRKDLLARLSEAKQAYQNARLRSAVLIEHAKEIGLDNPDGVHQLQTAIASEQVALAKLAQAIKAVRNLMGSGPDEERRQLLGGVLDRAIETTRARKGFIHVFHPAEDALKLEVQRGFDPRTLAVFEVVRDETCACGHALRTARRTVVDDITGSPIYQKGPFRTILLANGVRAVQSTPLFFPPGTVVGTLTTHYTKPIRPSERDLESIDDLATQVTALIIGLSGRQPGVAEGATRAAGAGDLTP